MNTNLVIIKTQKENAIREERERLKQNKKQQLKWTWAQRQTN